MNPFHSPTRHLFFTGKGGVGKTALSCAAAISLADRGRRVLVVSTDPASNLDEMLGVALGSQPTSVPGVANLSAMNIDQEGGRLGLRAFVNPMVVWIWLGTAIIALGAFLAWLPRRVRSAVTTAAAAAPAPPAGLTPGLGN